MQTIITLFETIVQLVTLNPIIALGAFILSFVANIIQIATFTADRSRLKREARERERLSTLVDTYEDVLKIAKERVSDQTALQALKAEIQQKENLAQSLEERAKILEITATKKLIQQSIDHHRTVLTQAYQEIERLNAQYAEFKLPEIPEKQREAIEQQVSLSLKDRSELPKHFVVRLMLLVGVLFLAPGPIAGILLPVFLSPVVLTVFEALAHFPGDAVPGFAWRWHRPVAFLICYSIWSSFVHAVFALIAEFTAGITRYTEITYVAALPLGLIFGYISYRAVLSELQVTTLPRLKQAGAPH